MEGSTLTSPLGPCYCPAPGRTTFLSSSSRAFDFLANNANWQAIVFEIGSPGRKGEEDFPESLRSDLQWTMTGCGGGIDFHCVAGGYWFMGDKVGWKCILREVTQVEDRAEEIKDFQPIEQLNSREKRHFTNSK